MSMRPGRRGSRRCILLREPPEMSKRRVACRAPAFVAAVRREHPKAALGNTAGRRKPFHQLGHWNMLLRLDHAGGGKKGEGREAACDNRIEPVAFRPCGAMADQSVDPAIECAADRCGLELLLI